MKFVRGEKLLSGKLFSVLLFLSKYFQTFSHAKKGNEGFKNINTGVFQTFHPPNCRKGHNNGNMDQEKPDDTCFIGSKQRD